MGAESNPAVVDRTGRTKRRPRNPIEPYSRTLTPQRRMDASITLDFMAKSGDLPRSGLTNFLTGGQQHRNAEYMTTQHLADVKVFAWEFGKAVIDVTYGGRRPSSYRVVDAQDAERILREIRENDRKLNRHKWNATRKKIRAGNHIPTQEESIIAALSEADGTFVDLLPTMRSFYPNEADLTEDIIHRRLIDHIKHLRQRRGVKIASDIKDGNLFYGLIRDGSAENEGKNSGGEKRIDLEEKRLDSTEPIENPYRSIAKLALEARTRPIRPQFNPRYVQMPADASVPPVRKARDPRSENSKI